MSNNDLERYVSDELHWDPKIDDSAVAVSADDGVVTLRGTLGSFNEKRDAKKDARRVYGVKSVKDELEVRILNKDRRADADLRGDVCRRSCWTASCRRPSTRRSTTAWSR